jgi:hypothetical protein
MIIKVDISEETWARMLTGKRVEGSMAYDLWTGKKSFRAYIRQSRCRVRDVMVKKLPWGWLKRSQRKWKVYLGVDSDQPLDEVLQDFESDHDEAMQAIVDQVIIDRV